MFVPHFELFHLILFDTKQLLFKILRFWLKSVGPNYSYFAINVKNAVFMVKEAKENISCFSV